MPATGGDGAESQLQTLVCQSSGDRQKTCVMFASFRKEFSGKTGDFLKNLPRFADAFKPLRNWSAVCFKSLREGVSEERNVKHAQNQ